jgi:hypothetical protein
MTYPEVRYQGETGEITAWLRRADHEPELTYPSGGSVHYLATGELTGGLFGLIAGRWGRMLPVRARTSTGPSRSRSTW